MECKTELQQAIYDILLLQIESGTYCYMEPLPTIEEAAGFFFVSVDTARAVYLRLKREGYISLSKNVGARVTVRCNPSEITRFIQGFFAVRKEALIDLSLSLKPLFTRAQWIGLKHISPETMAQMEALSKTCGKPQPVYAIWQYLEQNFAALGNQLLIRLAWQVYIFLYAPVFSINGSVPYLEGAESYERDILNFCKQEAWETLHDRISGIHDTLSAAISRFFQEEIAIRPTNRAVSFGWDAHRNHSQKCYSLATELLVDINRGRYPAGSYLPSAERLSNEKGVSVSTVRRAVSLLGSIGAVKSSRPLGARVLPFDESLEHCDLTPPVIQRQLLDLAESLQIFALSCRGVSEQTLLALDSDSLRQWREELERIRELQRYEVLGYCILGLLAKSAPYQAVRVIYSELLRLFFWGNPLRGMKGDRTAINAAYAPHLQKMIRYLKEADIVRFAAELEVFITGEFRETVDYLVRMGIPGADAILIPDESES